MIALRRGRTTLVLAALSVALASWPSSEVTTLTLFQRCGRSPWIILGEVGDSDDRLAEVRVVEVLKGEYALPTLRVVYRLENWLREGWEKKIGFTRGDTVALFLKRYDPEETEGTKVPEKLAAGDVFASTFGAMGVFPLPSEGQAALVEALRVFARATAIEDPVMQEEAVLEMLGASNPEIAAAGLEQTFARRLALAEHVPVLVRIAEGGREPEKIEALKILCQVAEDMRASGRSLPDAQDIVNQLKARVLGGEPEALRAEALKVIVRMGGAVEREFIRKVSREDASQILRYEASRALLELGD